MDIRIAIPSFGSGPGHGIDAAQSHVAVIPGENRGEVHRIPLPLGTTQIQVQRRMDGKFRAELKCGHQFVDAACVSLPEAVAAAVGKVKP